MKKNFKFNIDGYQHGYGFFLKFYPEIKLYKGDELLHSHKLSKKPTQFEFNYESAENIKISEANFRFVISRSIEKEIEQLEKLLTNKTPIKIEVETESKYRKIEIGIFISILSTLLLAIFNVIPSGIFNSIFTFVILVYVILTPLILTNIHIKLSKFSFVQDKNKNRKFVKKK
ncbi:MAG: hypothetical protein ACRCUP_03070 [Mycoplasmatales bacterium]